MTDNYDPIFPTNKLKINFLSGSPYIRTGHLAKQLHNSKQKAQTTAVFQTKKTCHPFIYPSWQHKHMKADLQTWHAYYFYQISITKGQKSCILGKRKIPQIKNPGQRFQISTGRFQITNAIFRTLTNPASGQLYKRHLNREEIRYLRVVAIKDMK